MPDTTSQSLSEAEIRETIVVNMLRLHGVDRHATREIVDHAFAKQRELDAKAEPVAIPENVVKYARLMRKQDYAGPLMWARTIIDWVADYKAPPHQPAAQDREPMTDDMVLRAARELCKIHAGECQVNEQDTWNLYADQFKRDARAALEAALGIKDPQR